MDRQHEDARLRALRAYRVLDAEAETSYDTLARLAASICGTPVEMLRRAADGTYGAVASLGARPFPGGRAIVSSEPFMLENAPADELTLPIPGRGTTPDLVLAVRTGEAGLAAADLTALELVASAFAIAVRNVALHAESERRRGEMVDARTTQADLVARLARDVRGPVTSIVGFARMLEDDDRFPPEAREALAMVRASGEHIAEVAADVELLSRMELAAVEPQWRVVDLVTLATAAGAAFAAPASARVVVDPDLVATALERLVEDSRRPNQPVRARVEDLGEAVALELEGTGVPPAGETLQPTIGARLAMRIVERHGGTFRAGGSPASWWVRLTFPADPRRSDRRVRVLLVDPRGERAEVGGQLEDLGFAVETTDAVRAGTPGVEVVLVSVDAVRRRDDEAMLAKMRRRVGLVALSPPDVAPAGDGWDATVAIPALPADLRAAVLAAAANARRRGDEGIAVPAN